MATYSQPTRITYSFGTIAFTTALTQAVNPPVNHNMGRVGEIHVRVTVTFTAVTTPALVNIGTAGTAAKYAQLSMGTAAAGTAANIGSAAGTPPNVGLVVFSDINLVRDAVTALQFQVVAPTGGSPAGTGALDIMMDWW